MKNFKYALQRALNPDAKITVVLVFLSAVLLPYIFLTGLKEDVVAFLVYALSAYTLTVLCMKIPWAYKKTKTIKEKNKYIAKYEKDLRLRIRLSLFGSLIMNVSYSAFQLSLGFHHKTVWYYALSAYYALLGVMRFFMLRHIIRYKPGENKRKEFYIRRFCGMALLVMNIALVIIVFYISIQGRGFKHHYITTIAMAVYTFSSLTKAVANIIEYRKYNSPVMLTAKAVNLASAAVSMLILETAMINAFGKSDTYEFRLIMTGTTGSAVCLCVLLMAVYMIVQSTKEIKNLRIKRKG